MYRTADIPHSAHQAVQLQITVTGCPEMLPLIHQVTANLSLGSTHMYMAASHDKFGQPDVACGRRTSCLKWFLPRFGGIRSELWVT